MAALGRGEWERLVKALEEDRELRYALAGLLGFRDLLEKMDATLNEIRALREGQEQLWRNQEKLWEEVKSLREGQGKLWEEVKALREDQRRLWEEVKALRENQEKLWEEVRALREDQGKLWEGQQRLWEEVKALREGQEKLWEEVRKLWEEVKALRENQEKLWEEVKALREGQEKLWEEVKALREEQGKLWKEVKSLREEQGILARKMDSFERRLIALGARWGIESEAAFREAMRGVVEEILGAGEVLRWVYYDEDGEVLGYPSRVEADILIKDKVHVLIEVKPSASSGDIAKLWRLGRLYEKKTGTKPRLVLVTPFIEEEALKAAKQLGIEVYTNT
ncbi:PD-(D/E)XK nuclease family protein [Thermofilum pendens]|uniref:DUF3782 domain-containing protein n=1 Tax=Thermofilum pendens (strain DSM 2475 / Hrk 5) TaxID=368408 RepID=A1RYV9_THEPD|nr:DUF3782 domain-containing protein [Thermofilum pendens]ABL78389.1 Protein of unknown function DUF1626 [Thermofilum pendens Hrk 5]